LGHFDPVSIAHIECFELIALIVKDDPAVGQDSVDIKQQEFNLFRF
jgi:hypothetical protein